MRLSVNPGRRAGEGSAHPAGRWRRVIGDTLHAPDPLMRALVLWGRIGGTRLVPEGGHPIPSRPLERFPMTTTRSASAVWNGALLDGSGQVTLDSSGIGTYPVSWPARSAEPNGVTSPEELIAAAHATCFAMALSNELAKAGTPPTELRTSAEVDFTVGTGITAIRLHLEGEVPGLDDAGFRAAAEGAKEHCPVSQALSAVPISLTVN